MPYPVAGEKKSAYIARFMKSGEAHASFPNRQQQLAVAFSMWAERNKKKARAKG